MAHILPENPPQALPTGVLRVFKALKALPDRYFVWHHLAPWQVDTPDFLIITDDGRMLLVIVSLSAATQANLAAQMLLIDDERSRLGQAEQTVLQRFLQSAQLPDGIAIETLVVFPNIPDKQVQASRLARQVGEPQWVGRELLQPDQATRWEHLFPAEPASSITIEKIRHHFTPEIIVPGGMTVRPLSPQRVNAGLTDYLLDYNQEIAVKNDLVLNPEDQGLDADFRLNIINGVAGSGKTLILLYRLRLLFHLYPDRHFLVLTHNRPLIHDLQSRFAALNKQIPKNIEWYTFNGWCYNHWPKIPIWRQPLSIGQRKQIIHQVWVDSLEDTSITSSKFLSEIDWIKDQLPLSEEDYLTVDRRGRGFGLSMEQRARLWSAYQSYQNHLQQAGLVDWADIPHYVWQFFDEDPSIIPQYDFILIDEAQFFAPLWISLLQRTLKPQNSHLFLVADPTQGFLGRRSTWKSLGLEARGRTHLLRQSYRTTREIMQFATLFYRQRLPEEKDEDILTPDILKMPAGTLPQVIPLSSAQDEIARVANEVAEFVRQGFPRQHLLVLHANANGVKNLISAIDTRLGKNVALDPKVTFPGDYVRVTTLNAGAGLESPVVFLVGLRALFEEEQSLRLSDDDREMLIRDNTRKIYMACTRAGQRLVFTYVGTLPANLQKLLGVG